MNTALKTLVALLSLSTLYFGFMYRGELVSSEPEAGEYRMPELKNEGVPAQSVPVTSLRDFNNAIVDIAERTNPTVVTVTTSETVQQRQFNPFAQFFGFPSSPQEEPYLRQGLGSGVIVSEDGYILTNNHVIERADEIRIELMDGEQLKATVVGRDPGSDVAVLKVDGENLSAISFGDSEALRVGELVLAIGSPLDANLAHTVSMGIVSAKSRNIGIISSEYAFEDFIQTDAAINPGNSGGALINMDGELIGINTAIASRSGGNQGIGFAIPINMVRDVMESIIEDGRVIRGYLGIVFRELDQALRLSMGLEERNGFYINRVVEGSPADEAGLQAEDVIVRLNGEPVASDDEFRFEIAGTAPGTEVELEVYRDGEYETITVILGELESEDSIASGQRNEDDLNSRLGFDVTDLTDNIRRQLGLSGNVNGAVVTSISQTSGAFQQGLRQFDVILQVQNTAVSNADEFRSAVRDAIDQGFQAIRVRVNRGGLLTTFAFELE